MASLFVYGTLLPGEVRWHHLERFVAGDGHADSVGGRLFDTGRGYPAARFGDDGAIVGHVYPLQLDRLAAALAHLDEVEGAVAGLYVRTSVMTHRGVEAFAYAYGEGLELTPIASGSWLEHRRGMPGG